MPALDPGAGHWRALIFRGKLRGSGFGRGETWPAGRPTRIVSDPDI